MQNAVFFLGANAPEGFCSLFGELQRPPVTRFHILKVYARIVLQFKSLGHLISICTGYFLPLFV